MTISKHPELPDYYVSSHDGWAFHVEDDGDLSKVDESILAWQEWREFLLRLQHSDRNEELDLDA